MSESIKVHRILKKAKSREDIGVVSKKFENDNRNEDFRNKHSKKPTPKEIVRLRKTESWKQLHEFAIAKAYAEVVAKLSFEFSGKEVHPIVIKRMSERWQTTFIKLDKLLSDLRIPTILYLRIHLKISKGQMVIPALATHNAINRFVDYLERDLSQKYIMPKDIEDAILELSSLSHSNTLRQLLTEFSIGRDYMRDIERYSTMLDSELALLLELKNLPGGYLITLDSLNYFRENNLLSDSVCEKIDRAKEMLAEPGVRAAFMKEVSARV